MLDRANARIRRDFAMARGSSNDRRALLRSYIHGGLRRAVPLIGTETAGGVFFSQTADKTMGRYLYSRGAWDAGALPEAIEIASISLQNRLMVEVGANIGTTTVQAAKLGARVLAFEPEPWNYRLLRANLAVNEVDSRVTAVRAGCSSSDRAGFMELSGTNFGDHRVSEAGNVPIELVTLDTYLTEHSIPADSVALLWLDTQGHEPEVLRGAEDLLAAQVPLVAEFWPEMIRTRLDELIMMLSEYSTIIDLTTQRPVNNLHELAEIYQKNWTEILVMT